MGVHGRCRLKHPIVSDPDAIEVERLRVLRSFDILDTDPDQAFDDVMLLAARICDAPIGMVSHGVPGTMGVLTKPTDERAIREAVDYALKRRRGEPAPSVPEGLQVFV